MARFVTDIPTPYSIEEVNGIINQFASVEGFTFTEYKGERLLKKGSGWLTAPQFIKVEIAQGNVHMEAWLKNVLLPGVYFGEMGIDGFYGIALKAVLKDRINKLIYSVSGRPDLKV